MEQIFKKYNRLIVIPVFMGYFILLYFSAFHHHVNWIPQINSSFSIDISKDKVEHNHEKCEVCHLISNSVHTVQNAGLKICYCELSYTKLINLVEIPVPLELSNLKLRAPPISLS